MKLLVMSTCVMIAAMSSADTGAQTRMNRIFTAVEGRMADQADYWFEDGEFPRAIHLLRFHNNLRPVDYEIATNLGWLLESTDQWDEALATYVRFRKQNPNDADAAFPEANFYYMKRIYAKVPPLLEGSLARKPHANSYRILAHSYEKMNMFADSLRIWDKLIEIDPANDAAKNNRNRVVGKLKAPKK